MRTLLVLGHGMAGHRLVEELRRRDTAGQWRVVAVTEDTRSAYDRVALTSYLTAGQARDLVGPALRRDRLVRLLTHTAVTRVDLDASVATCADGTELRYDALVLATGSRPFVPPVPGRELPGCFTYRTLDDLDAIRAAATPGATGVVVGGGLLGLEAADALRRLGMRPEVVELAPHLMPMQVDPAGAAALERRVRALGVRVHCGTGIAAVRAGAAGRAAAVALADGRTIEASLVIFAAGVRPRDELADETGLPRGPRGGFLVDRHCRTGAAGVWAVGECAAVAGRTYGLAAPGYRMAEAVARQLVTGSAQAGLTDLELDAATATRLKLLGVDVASFGDAHATTAGALRLAYTDLRADTYATVVLGADGRTLLGGVLVGDTEPFPRLVSALGRPLPAEPEHLLGPLAA